MVQVEGATAFVTGGSGFVGRNLIPTLVERGAAVRALARSEESARTVRELGAEVVEGDLLDSAALAAGTEGADLVFHAAAWVKDWGRKEDFLRVNVTGTERLLDAARTAGVERFVHVGTEAVLVGGGPIVRADETRPLPERSIGLYPYTKKLAEQAVLKASDQGLHAVVIRPRFIWGKGDTSVLSELVEALDTGRFRWIDRGAYLTSTCHVRNVCHGAILAAEKGASGGVYFLTDGEPVELRGFCTRLFASAGRDPGDQSVPWWLAATAASVVDGIWAVFKLKSRPPATRASLELFGREVTVDDRRAREELGYAPVIGIEEGLAEMMGGA